MNLGYVGSRPKLGSTLWHSCRSRALEETGNFISTPLTACPACSLRSSKAQYHKACKAVLAVVKVCSSRVAAHSQGTATAALGPSTLYLDVAWHFPCGLQAHQLWPLPQSEAAHQGT